MVNPSNLNDDIAVDMMPNREADAVELHRADALLETLASDTRRKILAELGREPMNTASVAEAADISIQNAAYHLEQLDDAGLVNVVGTHYSEKGHEMDVFAPALSAIVIRVEDEDLDMSGIEPAYKHRTEAVMTDGSGRDEAPSQPRQQLRPPHGG